MKKLLCGVAMILAVLVAGRISARNAADPKDIGTIMEEAHDGKDSLLKKTIAGKASADELKKLLALYQDLGKNEQPKGEKAAWKK
jgi:hypothetical protein